METVEQLWGGELPAFDNHDEVNALLGVLVNGLWNRLTEHQDSRNPCQNWQIQPDRPAGHCR